MSSGVQAVSGNKLDEVARAGLFRPKPAIEAPSETEAYRKSALKELKFELPFPFYATHVFSACELAKTDRQYLDHQAEYMSALTGSIGFERDFGFFCIGEPYGVDTDGGINLEQIPHTSKIFVVSDDKEWSDDIRAKVESCRRGSRPESLTMETAFKEFDWTGKPTLHDDFLSAMEDDSDDEGETVGISTGESAVKKMKLVSEENMNQSSSSDGILPAASNGASGSLEQISCIEQSGSTDGHADGISTL